MGWREMLTRSESLESIIKSLDRRVADHSARQLRNVGELLNASPLCDSALDCLKTVSKIRSSIRDWIDLGQSPSQVMDGLRGLVTLVDEQRRRLSTCHFVDQSRVVLGDIEAELCEAIAAVRELAPEPPPVVTATVTMIPTELLFQAHRTLFPAERMSILAGRHNGAETRLTAMFDVTGVGPTTHACHVDADPRLLAKALISMELAGSHFAAWIHSHPGHGSGCTFPSGIDRRQYADLVRDYSKNLVCAIVVANGYIRFWGDAVESGRQALILDGEGIKKSEEPHVYQLEG